MAHDDEIQRLVSLADEAAAKTADAPAEVADVVAAAILRSADPWLLIGVLAEGIVQTINGGIPLERRQECVVAVIAVLIERYRGNTVGRAV